MPQAGQVPDWRSASAPATYPLPQTRRAKVAQASEPAWALATRAQDVINPLKESGYYFTVVPRWEGVVDRIFVLDRVTERHPDVSPADAAHAWLHCIRSMPRLGKEPEEHVGIGYDSTGRLIEVVAVRNAEGDWLIKHAQTPPQPSIRRELGFGRRKQG